MPGSRWLKRVNGSHRTPATAIVVTSLLSVVVCLYAAAWFVVTSISTICVYLAYGIPVLLNLRNRLRRSGEQMTPAVAAWSLGRWSSPINVIAVIWIVIITIVFMLPPNELVLWTMIAVSIVLIAVWMLFARRNFRGPAKVAL
jgi:amino acid transporter